MSAVHELLSSLVPIAFAAHALHSLLYMLSLLRHICGSIPVGLFSAFEVLSPELLSPELPPLLAAEGQPPTSLLNTHHSHSDTK